jgi:putative transposase
VLLETGISISMDGRGRALDNIFVERLWRAVKYEDYLRGYACLPELLLRLTEYFALCATTSGRTKGWTTASRLR